MERAFGKDARVSLAKKSHSSEPRHKEGESQGEKEPHLGWKEEGYSESTE